MEPTAAKNEPITKVILITRFILTPINWLVSKSFETARIAIPILVNLIIATSANTSSMVSTGVITVTHFVVAPKIFTVFDKAGIVG